MRQLKNMFAQKRIIATIIYIATLIGTLIVAFTLESVILVVILMILQLGALVWYILSYIPFAQEAIKKYFCKLIGRGDGGSGSSGGGLAAAVAAPSASV